MITEIFLKLIFFQKHQEIAEQLAMQVLISVLRGDQNYHYEKCSVSL